MHSVKKIVAKQFLTKDMKEKVLERLEFRKIMKHKESDSVHTYYETALRRTFNTLTHSQTYRPENFIRLEPNPLELEESRELKQENTSHSKTVLNILKREKEESQVEEVKSSRYLPLPDIIKQHPPFYRKVYKKISHSPAFLLEKERKTKR